MPDVALEGSGSRRVRGWSRSSDVGVLVVAAVATVGLTALAVSYGAKLIEYPLAAVVVLGCAWMLTKVELARLPALALVAFAIFPAQYLPIPTHDGALNPTTAILLVFLVRAALANRVLRTGKHVVPLVLLLAWVCAATLLSPAVSKSLSWSANFVVLVGVPALLLPGWARAQDQVKSWWIGLGGVLGALGAIEFAMNRNPILGSIYTSAINVTQGSGPHRITTTLGHPITNGLFFALAAILGSAALLRGRRGFLVPATVFSFVGLLLSFSRGPLIGGIVGLAIVGLGLLGTKQIAPSPRSLLVGLSAVCLVAGGGYLLTGLRGAEAASSTASHAETLQAGNTLVGESMPWGGGPGLADARKRLLPSGDKSRGVESSAYQLAISLGIPGIILAVWLLATVAVGALRRQPEITACLAAYVIAASTYNLLESNRPALVLWGLLVGLSVSRRNSTDPASLVAADAWRSGREEPAVGAAATDPRTSVRHPVPSEGDVRPVQTILLTKFNVALVRRTDERRGLQPEWLNDRLRLFSRWTVPSVRTQTRPPDAWLIFADSATPEPALVELRRVTDGIGTVCPIDGLLPDRRIGEIVQEHLPVGLRALVSARLDSDDALAVNYLERVSAHAESWRGFVNARSGLQLGGGRLLRRWDSSGPFLSMIETLEPSRPPMTAFCVEHFRAEAVAPVLQLGGAPMWLQIIHGGNLANEVQGLPYQRSRGEAALGWNVTAAEHAIDPRNVLRAARAELLYDLKWRTRHLRRRQRFMARKRAR